MIYPDPIPECFALSKILDNQHGLFIPFAWYENMVTEGDFPDSIACNILAEICYWYRLAPIFDDNGRIIGYGKKFAADILQKSYGQLSIKFGYTERQIKDAVVRLEHRGLIKRVFRTILINGQRVSNILFIKVYPEAIDKISYITNADTHEKEKGLSRKSETAPTKKRQYTETTSKNTLKQKISAQSADVFPSSNQGTEVKPVTSGDLPKPKSKRNNSANLEALQATKKSKLIDNTTNDAIVDSTHLETNNSMDTIKDSENEVVDTIQLAEDFTEVLNAQAKVKNFRQTKSEPEILKKLIQEDGITHKVLLSVLAYLKSRDIIRNTRKSNSAVYLTTVTTFTHIRDKWDKILSEMYSEIKEGCYKPPKEASTHADKPTPSTNRRTDF